jgi:hypothetical protein
VIDQHNWTIYCGQDGMALLGEENSCQEHPDLFNSTNVVTTIGDPNTGAQYNVWPAPFEGPNVQ